MAGRSTALRWAVRRQREVSCAAFGLGGHDRVVCCAGSAAGSRRCRRSGQRRCPTMPFGVGVAAGRTSDGKTFVIASSGGVARWFGPTGQKMPVQRPSCFPSGSLPSWPGWCCEVEWACRRAAGPSTPPQAVRPIGNGSDAPRMTHTDSRNGLCGGAARRDRAALRLRCRAWRRSWAVPEVGFSGPVQQSLSGSALTASPGPCRMKVF